MLPRLPRPPRAPRTYGLTRPRSQAVPAPRMDLPRPAAETPWPPSPAGWTGSEAEWLIFWAHRPLDRGPAGGLWDYQAPLGGDISLAGFAPDFTEYDLDIAIDVNAPGQADRTRAIRELREIIARAFGVLLVFIDADQALVNPISALRDALNGGSTTRLA